MIRGMACLSNRKGGFDFDTWNKGALKFHINTGHKVSESLQQPYSRRFHKHRVGSFTSGNILSFNQNRNIAVRAAQRTTAIQAKTYTEKYLS